MQERKICERIRIIAVIGLIFVLFMTIAGGKTRVQAAGAALSVSSVSAEKGGKVKAEYDSSALQLKSMSNGNVFPVSEAICNEAKGVYVANSSDFNNVTGNGTLFTLEFKVLDGADAASCNVSVKLEKAQNVDGGKIDVSGGSGKVTVEKCIHNKKTQTVAATCETEGETKVVCTKCGFGRQGTRRVVCAVETLSRRFETGFGSGRIAGCRIGKSQTSNKRTIDFAANSGRGGNGVRRSFPSSDPGDFRTGRKSVSGCRFEIGKGNDGDYRSQYGRKDSVVEKCAIGAIPDAVRFLCTCPAGGYAARGTSLDQYRG